MTAGQHKKKSFEEEFLQLQGFFIQGLPKRLNSLKNFLKQFLEHENISSLENLHREVHNLAGASASYKLANLATSARQLEDFIQEGQAAFTSLALTSDWQANLQEQIQVLALQLESFN